MLIKNGTLYTMKGDEVLRSSDLRIRGDKIAEIGQDLTPEEGERVLDVKGAWVLPGFIDAHCHIGIDEVGIGREGDDTNEMSSPLTPEIDALDGINPMDTAFGQAVRAGVTTVMTGPGSANVMGGLFTATRTWGSVIDKMRLEGVTAMKCALGENPKRVYGSKGNKPMTRMESAALLREILQKAKNYLNKKEEAERKGESAAFEIKPELEHLIPVLRKEIPLKCHAHRADDILTSVRIAREFDVRLTMDHCTEAHLIADELAENDFPALIGPTLSTASKPELCHKGYQAIIELAKRGKCCCVITDHPVISIDLLPLCAGYAYKEGLPLMDALRAITINPARVLGIEKDYGSLEEGKHANLTIYSDNPLCNLSYCLFTIGDGKVLWQDIEHTAIEAPARV